MKPLRIRVGPPVPAAAVAFILSLLPALFLCLVLTGKETFRHFMEGPIWILAATLPLWLLRRQTVVDAASRHLRVRWGFWIPFLFVVPFFWRRYSIEDAVAVVLQTEVRGGEEGKTTYYVTRVGGRAASERLTYRPARRDAERIAEALGLPMSDSVDNASPVTRPARSVSKPLRARLLNGEVDSPDPRRPDWTDLVRRDQDGILAIDRPPVLSFMPVYPTVSFWLLLNAVVWLEYTPGGPASKESTVAFFVIAPLLGLLGLAAIVGSIEKTTVRWSVEVTEEVLRVRKLSWIRRSSNQMKLAELEELSVGQAIRLRSDRSQLEFADDLDPEEREWVGHELLRRIRGA